MSILFGFVGSPSSKFLDSMSGTLSHRVHQLFTKSTTAFSIGFRTDKPHSENKFSGLVKSENQIVALSGFQTLGESRSKVTLQNIFQELKTNGSPPENLSGDFLFAGYQAEGDFFLVRDPAGTRTVFYAEFDNRLFFSSEPKGIWNLPGFPRKIDENSFAKYLAFSFVPESSTMLKNIKELPAGHFLHRDSSGKISIHRYFHFEDFEYDLENSSSICTGHNWIDRFRRVFNQSISDRLEQVTGTPTVFLSGGLDSSIVAAELQNQSSVPIETYSLHFGEKYPNELEFAGSVAASLKTDHTEVLIEPKDFTQNLREMIWHLDDPIGDPITMPNYELAKVVGKKTDYVFNGEGGDPCFGGPKNLSMLVSHWYGLERESNFRELEYLKSYRRAYEEIDHIFTPEFSSCIDRESLPAVLTPYFECRKPNHFLNKLMAINIRLKGAHLILPKVERMLAASGISPLSPLFSQEIVKLSFQLPPKWKLAKGIEKIVLKEAFRREIPEEIIQRPKSGMRVPVHFWFQSELKNTLERSLVRVRFARLVSSILIA